MNEKPRQHIGFAIEIQNLEAKVEQLEVKNTALKERHEKLSNAAKYCLSMNHDQVKPGTGFWGLKVALEKFK